MIKIIVRFLLGMFCFSSSIYIFLDEKTLNSQSGTFFVVLGVILFCFGVVFIFPFGGIDYKRTGMGKFGGD